MQMHRHRGSPSRLHDISFRMQNASYTENSDRPSSIRLVKTNERDFCDKTTKGDFCDKTTKREFSDKTNKREFCDKTNKREFCDKTTR